MTKAAARQEMRDAITYYEGRGLCWVSVVTYIGITALFGGWRELVDGLRSHRCDPRRPRVALAAALEPEAGDAAHLESHRTEETIKHEEQKTDN